MIERVKTVCFVGAGTMGCFNSMVTAIAGYKVFLYDISEDALWGAPKRQRGWGETLARSGFCTKTEVEAGLKRVTYTTDAEKAAGNADMLSESVLEEINLKRKVHQQFDRILPAHAVMTTNSSSLLVSDIESAVKRGDKFAAMHFHQPQTLVDIVGGPRTSLETIDLVKRFVLSQRQEYVELKKERTGYLHNAMFGALVSSALSLAAVFEADIREIDRSWMLNRGYVAGPFGMIDYVGVDVIAKVFEGKLKAQDPHIPAELAQRVLEYLRPFIDSNNLGMKTGKGFYSFPEPDFIKPDFLEGKEENRDLSAMMLNALLMVALTLVAEGYADMEDVEKSWAVIHPPDIGPFATIDRIGLDVVKKGLLERAEMIESLVGDPGSSREDTEIAISLLDQYIARGELGVKTGKGFYTY